MNVLKQQKNVLKIFQMSYEYLSDINCFINSRQCAENCMHDCVETAENVLKQQRNVLNKYVKQQRMC